MKTLRTVLLSAVLMTPLMAMADSTYVFFRHGEKPDNTSGQLTCKGLNRALSLPSVLLSRYGTPDALYASAPKEKKLGSSLRPLTTITPLAIQVSKPVVLRFHADQTDQLVTDLLAEKNSALTFLSWEHKNLVTAARTLVTETGGDAAQVPAWPSADFDSIYVVQLDAQQRFKSFARESEGLNGVADACPGATR